MTDSPPPYSDQDPSPRNDPHQNEPGRAPEVETPNEDRALSPPPYEDGPRAEPVGNPKSHTVMPGESSSGEGPAQVPTPAITSTATTSGDASPDSKGKSPLSFVRSAKQAYEERREAREAKRKVDFYEKIYGFVPKNVMSEAEWRKARERAPKEKSSASWRRSNVYWLDGVGGGGGS